MSATTRIPSRSVFETAASARSADTADGHDHAAAHGHDHHHGDHSHAHGHRHGTGRDHPPRGAAQPALRPVRIAPSLIRAGLLARLGGAAVLLTAVWSLTALVTG